jgi:hypothetical protein
LGEGIGPVPPSLAYRVLQEVQDVEKFFFVEKVHTQKSIYQKPEIPYQEFTFIRSSHSETPYDHPSLLGIAIKP